MHIQYTSDPFEDRPGATVERFSELRPTSRGPSDIGANTDYRTWRYEFDGSRWFDDGELLKLEPGEYTDFQSHRADVEGPYEKCLCVFSGRGVLRTERSDEPLEQFDYVLVPPGAAYQLGNVGTEALWIGSWTSVGPNELQPESGLDPSERPGAREEYERIMAARSERGLSTAPGYDGQYDGDPDENRPEPRVTHFAEKRPKMFHASPEVGTHSDRPDWIYAFPDSEWISQGVVVRLDPGVFIGFHSHMENEGPVEELYWVLNGRARLQTEYRDETLEQFDCAYFPTGCAHTVGNVGSERVWVAAWLSKGGQTGEFDIDELETSERPGLEEEFERVMAARKKRGLPLPPDVEVELD